MLEKLKSTLTGNKDKDQDKHHHHQQRPTLEPISIITSEQLKAAKKWLEKIKQDCQFFGEITAKHRSQLKAFIAKQQEERSSKENAESKQSKDDEQDQELTLAEDILDVKDAMKAFMEYVGKLQVIENQVRLRVEKYNAPAVAVSNPETEQRLARCEQQLRKSRESEKMEKEMQETLKQQCVLYTEQTRKLQDRLIKLEKELGDKNASILNLNEQKQLLLDMKNSTHPEVEGLKQKILEFEKRLQIEKSRLQQKDKQLEGLRKKLEEERANILTMADELKDKEMKCKKAIDKYEKSKVEVRKFREQKTDLIKNLNLEIQGMKDQELKHAGQLEQSTLKLKAKEAELEELRSCYDSTVSSNLRTFNAEQQNRQLTEALREREQQLADRTEQCQKLHSQNEQLKHKRQLLLATLQKPVKHEVKTLEKIHKAMQQLYKDYIIDVFDRGDTVQFERKISTIMTNILELKEDLLM